MYGFRPVRYASTTGNTAGEAKLVDKGSAPKVVDSDATIGNISIPVTGSGHCSCEDKETVHINETNIEPAIDHLKEHSMEAIMGKLKSSKKTKKGKGLVRV